MEDAGNKQGAVIEALTAYANTIESRGAPSLGLLAKSWHAVADAASRAGQAIMDVGRPSNTDTRLADLQAQLADLTKRGPRGSAPDMSEEMGRGRTRGDQVASLQGQIAALQAVAAAEKMARDASASRAAVEATAIAGKPYEESILRQAHALSERTQELKKWAAQRDADQAAGSPMSAADYSAGVAEINKRYSKQPGDAQAAQYTDLEAKIRAFNQTTEDERNNLEKLTDGQRLVIQAQEDMARSSDKMSEKQKALSLAHAQAAAAMRDEVEASLALKKSFMDDSDRAVKESAAAMAKQLKSIESFQNAGSKQVTEIDFQTSLVGKDPTEAARMQAKHAIDLEASAALESASGQGLNDILAAQAKRIDDVTAALGRQKAAQDALRKSFSAGVNGAAADWIKKSQDDAAAGAKTFNDTMNGMTDAITKFAETGSLSFKTLFQTLADDIIRWQVNSLLGKGLQGLGFGGSDGSTSGLFSALLGSGGGASSLWNGVLTGGLDGASFASGIDSVPYNGMPAVLHEGERVMTKIENQRSQSSQGVTIHIDQSGMSFGAGVDASTVAQAVRAGMNQTKYEIQRALTTTGNIR